MNESKYIIIDHMGVETPILFPVFVEHSFIAMGSKVISAGFFDVWANEEADIVVSAYGKSVTLNVKNRDEDAEIIERLLRS